MAVSGKTGASRFGLNRSAWAPSLKREIARNAFSAEAPSITSQPARKATAPRIRQELRCLLDEVFRIDARNSFSLAHGCLLRARDHRAQAFRHKDREHDVDDQEPCDRAHSKAMHDARIVVSAED